MSIFWMFQIRSNISFQNQYIYAIVTSLLIQEIKILVNLIFFRQFRVHFIFIFELSLGSSSISNFVFVFFRYKTMDGPFKY